MPTNDDHGIDGGLGREARSIGKVPHEELEAVLLALFDSLPRSSREELIPLDECFASLGVDIEADEDPAAPTPG